MTGAMLKYTPSSTFSSWAGATPDSPTRISNALAPSPSAASTAVLTSSAATPGTAWAGKASATFQQELTSRSASPPRENGHSPGSGGSGSSSSAVYSG